MRWGGVVGMLVLGWILAGAWRSTARQDAPIQNIPADSTVRRHSLTNIALPAKAALAGGQVEKERELPPSAPLPQAPILLAPSSATVNASSVASEDEVFRRRQLFDKIAQTAEVLKR